MSIILLLKHLCIKRNKYYDLTTSIQTIAMAASQQQAKGAGSCINYLNSYIFRYRGICIITNLKGKRTGAKDMNMIGYAQE